MANEPRCPGCGAPLDPTFRFCAHCGRAAGAPGPLRRDTVSRTAPAPEASRAAPQRREQAAAAPLRLVPVRHDGRAGAPHPIGPEGVLCGRTEGQLAFPDDPTVSPRHARFTPRADGATVEDLGSLNGTFLRLRAPRPLEAGDEVRLGRQVLRLEPMPRPAAGAPRPWGSPDVGCRLRLVQILDGGGTGEAFPLRPGENPLGREAGLITFPNDRYVSARHARLDVLETGVVLLDVGSSNGTFVRLTAPAAVAHGDQVLVGMQLVRVE